MLIRAAISIAAIALCTSSVRGDVVAVFIGSAAALSDAAVGGLPDVVCSPVARGVGGESLGPSSVSAGQRHLDELNWLTGSPAHAATARDGGLRDGGISAAARLPATPPPMLQTPASHLPAAPDSTVLALIALGSVGAFQLGRLVGRIDLHLVPEWYHPGGPDQIGYSHRYVPTDSPLDLPVCVFDQPAIVEVPVVLQVAPRALGRACQGFLIRANPRGPPPGDLIQVSRHA